MPCRTSAEGYALNFNFNYLSSSDESRKHRASILGAHREDHSGVVCYITVSVHVEWNSNVEPWRWETIICAINVGNA